MDCIVHGVTKSPTQLSDFHFHFHSGWGPPPARGEMLASSLFGKGNLKATVWFKFSLKWHNHKQQGQKESSNTFASVIYCGYSSDVRHMHSENSLRLLELQWKKKKNCHRRHLTYITDAFEPGEVKPASSSVSFQPESFTFLRCYSSITWHIQQIINVLPK